MDERPLPLVLGENDNLELHLYIDSSVIEVIANEHIACTRRFYPSGGRPQNVRLQWLGKTTGIGRLSTWRPSPISPNRLTT